MVKKAVAEIKAAGSDKSYALINDRSGPFIDRDLYIVVYGLDGVVLAHGADAKRIGTNQIGDKDPDGKAFVQERVELAAKELSFWQNYKFINPVTKKIEPKEMYCERLDQTAVCGGVSISNNGEARRVRHFGRRVGYRVLKFWCFPAGRRKLPFSQQIKAARFIVATGKPESSL